MDLAPTLVGLGAPGALGAGAIARGARRVGGPLLVVASIDGVGQLGTTGDASTTRLGAGAGAALAIGVGGGHGLELRAELRVARDALRATDAETGATDSAVRWKPGGRATLAWTWGAERGPGALAGGFFDARVAATEVRVHGAPVLEQPALTWGALAGLRWAF